MIHKHPIMKTTLYIISFLSFFYTSLHGELIKRKPLKIGDPIPPFSLIDQNGESFDSIECIGKQPVVIFFYPKNNAPICTTEACSFRDSFDDFTELNAKVIGISPDDIVSHRDFQKKNNLQYTLLSDYNNIVYELFGVSKRDRITFIANKKGRIVYVFNNRKNGKMHTSQALIALRNQS